MDPVDPGGSGGYIFIACLYCISLLQIVRWERFFFFTSLDLGAGCPESCVVYSAPVSRNLTEDFGGPGRFRGGLG